MLTLAQYLSGSSFVILNALLCVLLFKTGNTTHALVGVFKLEAT